MTDLTTDRNQTLLDSEEKARRLAACYRLLLKVSRRRHKPEEIEQTPVADSLDREAVTGAGTQAGEPGHE